jgi:hypothetical protein
LSEGHDVAAAIVSGLMLNHLSATANSGHCLLIWIPTDDSKSTIRFQDALQHHSVTRLEDMQRQNVAWEKNHIRQRKQREFSDGQINHAGFKRRAKY